MLDEKKLLKTGIDCCPFCGGNDIDGDDSEYVGIYHTIILRCLVRGCDKKWKEKYKLVGVKEILR